MTKLKLSIAFMAIAFVFASCKTNSTSPNGGGGGSPLIAAHPGSSFMFTTTQTDQNGNVINTTHTTDSIEQTGITYQGRSNVIQGAGWDDQGNNTTGYYSLLPNGDVDLYLGPLAPGIVTQWLTLPFTSGGPITTTIEDQTVSNGGVTERSVETATYKSGPDTTMVVQGTRLNVKQVIGTYVATTYVNGTVLSTQQLPGFQYYWAPTIGFSAGAQYSTSDGFGNTVNTVQVLTSYTLR